MIQEQREKREAEQAAQEKARRQRAVAEARRRHLESVRGKEGALWYEVDKLIAAKHAVHYDKAVLLLNDLHDLAQMDGAVPEFQRRMGALQREHARKDTLIDRFRNADLLN